MTFSSLEGGCSDGGWVPSTCCSLAGCADCFIFLSLLGERLPRLRCSHSSTCAARFRSASVMCCRSSLVTSVVWVPRLSGVGLLIQVWYMKQNKVLISTYSAIRDINEKCKMVFWNRELNWIYRSINALICSGKGCYLPSISIFETRNGCEELWLQYSAAREGSLLRTMWLRPQVFFCITSGVNTKQYTAAIDFSILGLIVITVPYKNDFFPRCLVLPVEKDYWITDEWRPRDKASG